MSLLADFQILQLCRKQNMIAPFQESLIREIEDMGTIAEKLRIISYGLSSYGYDLRLCSRDFRIFRHIPGEIVDPRNFNTEFLENAPLQYDDKGLCYFILPGNSYALGVTVERLQIPHDVTCIFIGKSTYARCGVIANLTPGEAGWRGYLTIELSNSSSADVKIYANQGILQALFFQGPPCQISYEDRTGKYQDQSDRVTLARV